MTLKDIDLAKLTITQGIKATGAVSMDHSGWSVSGAGNINGDNCSDFIIGAYTVSPLGRKNAGETYLIFGKSSGLIDIDLKNLTITQGIKILGANQNDNSGSSVSGAGDVNGDGYNDLIIAATKKSYLIFGKNTSFTNIDLGTLTLSQGITMVGSNIKNNTGWAVSNAGDVNNDGYDDFIIGSHHENPLGRIAAGETYLIFGKKTLTNIDLVTLSLPQGIKIMGANINDNSGWSVSSAGDVNNDGYDDIIISARYATPLGRTNAGETYLIFGKRNGFADIDLKTLTPPQGIKILGADLNDNSGWAVSNAGDVNSDGYDDIIIGARYANPLGLTNAGETYLIFGKSNDFVDIDLKNLTLTQGIKISGADLNDNSGSSVSNAGDVNNDGYDDMIIGAPSAPKGTFRGETYILFGENSTSFSNIDLGNFTTSQGIKIKGAATNDYTGSSVSSVGDVNNDGYDDVIIGATDATSLERYEAGESYLIFGDENNSPPTPPTPIPTPTPNISNLGEYFAIGTSIFSTLTLGALIFYGYRNIKRNQYDYLPSNSNINSKKSCCGMMDKMTTTAPPPQDILIRLSLNHDDMVYLE